MVRVLFFISILYFSFGFSPLDREIENPVIGVEKKIIISPNPAVSFTKVYSKRSTQKIIRVQVFSIVNQKMLDVAPTYSSKSVELNLYKLRNGKYFVKVFMSDGSEEIATLIKTS